MVGKTHRPKSQLLKIEKQNDSIAGKTPFPRAQPSKQAEKNVLIDVRTHKLNHNF